MNRATLTAALAVTVAMVALGCVPEAPPPTTVPPLHEPASICYPGADYLGEVAYTDLFYNGPIDTLANATFYESYNGDCGVASLPATIVYGPDETTAANKCLVLEGTGLEMTLVELFPTPVEGPLQQIGQDYYQCSPSTVSPAPVPDGECYTFVDGTGDLSYNGVPNSLTNARFFASTDRTCVGPIVYTTLLIAPNGSSAQDTCDQFFPPEGVVGALDLVGLDDAWYCFPDLTVELPTF